MKKLIGRAKDAVINFFNQPNDSKNEKQDSPKTKRDEYLELMKTFLEEYGSQNKRKFPDALPYPNPDLLVQLSFDNARELLNNFYLESIGICKICIQSAQMKKVRAEELLKFIGDDDIYEAKCFIDILKNSQNSADDELCEADREIESCERERQSLLESFDEHIALLVKQLTQLKSQSVSTGRDFNEIIDEYFSTLDPADYSEEALTLAKLIVLGRGKNGVKRLPN